jgi:hypothetical protein
LILAIIQLFDNFYEFASGVILFAGPLGLAVGEAMGGKRVSSILTITYLDKNDGEKHILLDAKLGDAIKKQYELNRAR